MFKSLKVQKIGVALHGDVEVSHLLEGKIHLRLRYLGE